MRESLFSKQVMQPFLANPFPLSKQSYEERIHKHVTFLSDDDVILRLKTIDHNWKVASEINEKTINLQISENMWDKEIDKIRIKGFLSTPVSGIRESHWVNQHHVDYNFAQSLNQYRVRGISEKGWSSDWVYSEIRDIDNDLVVYELLHDILDMLNTAYDGNLEYLLDNLVFDAFNSVFYSSTPKLDRSVSFEESQLAKIQELIQMFGTILKADFNENIVSSFEEFASVFRTHKLMETYKEAKTDFFALLVEHYLEEHYGELIKKLNLEVMLQNDEELQLLLQSTYEFDIKGELIGSAYSLDPTDHFVTHFNDAVQLISEPIVFERFTSGISEEFSQLFRMAIKELYVPLNIVEKMVSDINFEAFDTADVKAESDLIEFTTEDLDKIVKHMLVADVFESLIDSSETPLEVYEMDLIDRILGLANVNKISILLDYSPLEFIEIMAHIEERFSSSLKKFKQGNSEEINVSLNEQHFMINKVSDKSFAEEYQTTFEELTSIRSVIGSHENKETLQTELTELVSFVEAELEQDIIDLKKVNIQEMPIRELKTKNFRNKLLKSIVMREVLRLNNIDLYRLFRERKRAASKESYYNLFKLNPVDRYHFLKLENREIHMPIELNDKYFIKGDEVVRYILGETDGQWPIGKFTLGLNTLKGASGTTVGG